MIASIDPTSAIAATSATSATTGDSTLGKDDFLQLLVAQLSQQDPLNPQDGAEFVAQLAQFSNVEQLMNISGGMQDLAVAQQAQTSAQVVGFIGRDVVAGGDSFYFDGSQGSVSMDLGAGAEQVTIEVVDASGETVATVERTGVNEGEQSFQLTAEELGGLGEGSYQFKVTALDDEGEKVSAQTRCTGRVVGVTFDSGYPELLLDGDRRLSLADVIRVGDGTTSLESLSDQPAEVAAADESEDSDADAAGSDESAGAASESGGQGADISTPTEEEAMAGAADMSGMARVPAERLSPEVQAFIRAAQQLPGL